MVAAMADPWSEIALRYADVSGDVRQHFLHPAVVNAVREEALRSRCLDFGCGPGEVAEKLLDLCDEVVAVDRAAGAVDVARRRLGVRATAMETDAFKGYHGFFDVIVLSMVLTTIESDAEAVMVLSELHDRLDISGRLIVAITHPCFTFRALSQVGYANSGAAYRVPIVPGLEVDEYHRPLERVIGLLADAGLRIEKAREIYDTPEYYRVLGEEPHRFAGTLPMFLILVCEKANSGGGR